MKIIWFRKIIWKWNKIFKVLITIAAFVKLNMFISSNEWLQHALLTLSCSGFSGIMFWKPMRCVSNLCFDLSLCCLKLNTLCISQWVIMFEKVFVQWALMHLIDICLWRFAMFGHATFRFLLCWWQFPVMMDNAYAYCLLLRKLEQSPCAVPWISFVRFHLDCVHCVNWKLSVAGQLFPYIRSI